MTMRSRVAADSARGAGGAHCRALWGGRRARHGFSWWTSAAMRDSGSAPPRLKDLTEGVARSATSYGRHVTVRAQLRPREWALHEGFQAAPRSPHYWSRGRPAPANCTFCEGGARSDKIDAVPLPPAARGSHRRHREERDFGIAVFGVVHPVCPFCPSPSPAQQP